MKFKQQHTFENRKTESDRVIGKYPDRIPVVIERTKRSKVPNIDRNKYLVPKNLTMGQLVYVIRKRIRIEAEKAIFLFVDKQIYVIHQLFRKYMHIIVITMDSYMSNTWKKMYLAKKYLIQDTVTLM